jgi:tripeptide aminopeptidase
VSRATAAERERLHETFEALCRIESPSGRERPCTDWVASALAQMGVAVEEDDAGPAAGADAGNLFARIPGRREGSIMMCAHLDTVPPTAPLEPELIDGGWRNAHPGIIGADNKAAVAVMLELARRMGGAAPGPSGAAPGPELGADTPEVGLELVFTVSEENGLHGAKAFDVARLSSPFGFVFDHATPIGEIVVASPTYQRVTADLHGRAAHAGIRPESGRSAIVAAAAAIATMPLGRLDQATTCNVGTITGGTATNVVPERCRVEGEVRGLDDDRVEQVLTEMIDRFQDAADAGECDLDITVERMFRGYRAKTRAPHVVLAERALAACGYAPRHIATGGGSDANAFEAAGLPTLNLANGTERNHEPDERVSTEALEGMLEVAIALVHEATDLEVR